MLRRHVVQFVTWAIVLSTPAFGCSAARSGGERQTRAPLAVPPSWLDLPASPFAVVHSSSGPALSNRTRHAISSLTVGCIRETAGVVEVVGHLFTQDLSQGAWSKDYPDREALFTVDAITLRPEHFSAPPISLRPCPPGSRTAVTAAGSREGYRWTAAGTAWPSR